MAIVVRENSVEVGHRRLLDEFNGRIHDENIAPNAAITGSKVTTATSTALGVITLDSIGGVNGWIPAGETWTYASAATYTNTNTTYGGTFTITGDKTAKYTPGMRVVFTQSTGGAKYAIITKVAYSSPNTTVTVFFGTSDSMADEAITSPFYSMVKMPQGFPSEPSLWTVSAYNESDATTSLTALTWANVGDPQISLPLGAWDMWYEGAGYASEPAATNVTVRATISTATNSETDSLWTSYGGVGGASGTQLVIAPLNRRRHVTSTADDVFYLNITPTRAGGAGDVDAVGWLGTVSPTAITAVCAYL